MSRIVTHISENQNGMMISATDSSDPFQENMQHQPSDHAIPCEKSDHQIQSKTTHDDDTKIYRKNGKNALVENLVCMLLSIHFYFIYLFIYIIYIYIYIYILLIFIFISHLFRYYS